MQLTEKIVAALYRQSAKWPLGTPTCSLKGCSGTKSLWGRIMRRRQGTRLNGDLYCEECLQAAIGYQLLRLRNQTSQPPSPNRIPLGLLMVARGKLTYQEVTAALHAQRRARSGTIGEWIEKLGFASELEVTAALGLQWGCPVASSLERNGSSQVLPLTLLEAFLMWPVQHVLATNTLYIAFGKRVDHTVLYAIETMLGCRTQPCIAAPRLIAKRIEREQQEAHTHEIVFGSMWDTSEMTRTAVGYISKVGAEEVRISRVPGFIWLTLKRGTTFFNLLFQLRVQRPPLQVSLTSRMPAGFSNTSTYNPDGVLHMQSTQPPAQS